MLLTLRDELIFVTATLSYRGASVEIPWVLVDTGAASTVIDADLAGEAGVILDRGDRLRVLRGVGGHEHVFVREVDRFAIGGHGIDRFELEVGELDYGFEVHGILGLDFLRAVGAVIDLGRMTLDFG